MIDDRDVFDETEEETPVGRRRRGREVALGYLYALDVKKRGGLEDFEAHVVHQRVKGAAKEFAKQIVRGVLDHKGALDAAIHEVAKNWRVARMAVLDRNILRIAVYEFTHEPEIPTSVTINEAVELAKRFSTAQSGAFVNGILDKLKNKVST